MSRILKVAVIYMAVIVLETIAIIACQETPGTKEICKRDVEAVVENKEPTTSAVFIVPGNNGQFVAPKTGEP